MWLELIFVFIVIIGSFGGIIDNYTFDKELEKSKRKIKDQESHDE